MHNDDRHRNLYENPAATLDRHHDSTLFLMSVISHGVLPFLRRNLGYRLLQRWVFTLHLLFLSGIGYWEAFAPHASVAEQKDGLALYVIGLTLGWLFQYQRRRAWKGAFREVNAIHSFERGDSRLTPFFARLGVREWIVQRWIEPLLLLGTGGALVWQMHTSILGWWLICAGRCLFYVEGVVLRRAKDILLDLRDARIEAQALKQAEQAAVSSDERKRTTKTAAAPMPRPAALSPELMDLRSGDYTVTRSRKD